MASIFLLITMGIGIYFLLTHRAFQIKYVKVEGNVVVSDSEVLGQLGDVNSNIFLFSGKKAGKAIKELPGIQETQISKQLPNRLLIQIHESYILGIVNHGKDRWYIDEQGHLTDQVDSNLIMRLKPLPVLGVDPEKKPGDIALEDERNLQLLQTLVQTKLADEVVSVNFEKMDNIDIMYKKIKIHFGSANNIYKKLEILSSVIHEITTKKIPAVEILMNEGQNPIVVTNKSEETKSTKETGGRQ